VKPVHGHLRAWLEAVASLPGGTLRRDGGLTWCGSGIPWPMFNGAIAIPEAGPCDAAAGAAAELAATGVPWFWWALPDTPPDVLEAAASAGASEFDHEAPWMEAEVAALPDCVVPDGVTVEEVVDEAGYRVWAATVREIYDFPASGEVAWTMPAERCGWSGLPWQQWIAWLDGEPVGVSLLFCGGGVAGLFGVGSRASARRRGIGSALTLLPLAGSGERVAGFFATPEGEALYRALGFRTEGWVSRWLGGFDVPAELATARGAAASP
jgi:hypothetical protein